MRANIVRLLAVALICMCGAAAATPIVYSVHVSDGTETVSGTITTDGTLGELVAANITAWSLTATGPVAFSIHSTDFGAAVFCGGGGGPNCGASATPTLLIHDPMGPPPFPELQFFLNSSSANDVIIIGDPNTLSVLHFNAVDIGHDIPIPTGIVGSVQVPEPATATLLILALACLGFARKRLPGRQSISV